jgi:hypothetical protein
VTLPKLESVEKLREIRERSASAELESSNRARDHAETSAMRFGKQLELRTMSVRERQSELYQDILNRPVSSSDLEFTRARVDTGSAELDHLAKQCNEANEAAIEAGAQADRAREKYAKLFRAHQKWTALVQSEAEKAQKAESFREELTIEDNYLSRTRR